MRGVCVVLLLFSISPAALAGDVPNAADAGEARPPAANAADPIQETISGTVTEVVMTRRYTYVELDTGTERIWAAGPVTAVVVGDRVSLSGASATANFFSPTLGRKFDLLYLVGEIGVLPIEGASPPSRHEPSPHEAGEGEE